jgi:hypothetical protein
VTVAGTRKLVIEILGNAKDAASAFGDVRKHSDITKERLDKFGTAALGAGVAIAGGLAFAVKEFVAADEQSRKLDNSIKNSSQSFSRGGDAIRELTTSIQNMTGADGDALVGASALAVQWGMSESQINQLLPLVNDLSMKMGVDVDSAMKAVLKSSDGSTTALRKMGIQVDATKASTDPFAATMDALKGSVQGFGEEAGNTAAGKLNILKAQIGDLAEAVGGGALDIFGPLISGMTSLTGAAGDTSQSVGTFAGQFGVIASGALIGIGGLIKVKGALDTAKTSLTDGEGALNNYGKAAAGLAAIAAIVPVFDLVAGAVNDGAGRAQQMTDAWNQLKIALNQGATGAGDVWQAFAQGVGAEQNTLRLQNLWQEFGSEIDLVGTGVKADVEQVQRAFDNLGQTQGPDAQRAALNQLEAATAKLPKNSDQYKTNSEFIDRNRKSLELKTQASKVDADATDSNTAAIDEQSAALKALTDPVFGAMRAQQQNTQAQEKYAEAQNKVTFLMAAGKAGSSELATAQRELQTASIDAGSSAVNQQSALASLGGAMANGTVSADGLNSTLSGLVQSGQLSAGAALQLAASFNNGTAPAASNAAGKALGVTAAVGTIPTSRTTTIDLSTGSFDAKYAEVIRKQGVMQAFMMVGPAPAGTGPKRATGGSVQAGRPYLVGERGPEVVVPGSGYVIPTRRLVDQQPAMAGGGGITVNVTAGVGDPVAIGRSVVESLKAYERTNGTAWRN